MCGRVLSNNKVWLSGFALKKETQESTDQRRISLLLVLVISLTYRSYYNLFDKVICYVLLLLSKYLPLQRLADVPDKIYYF